MWILNNTAPATCCLINESKKRGEPKRNLYIKAQTRSKRFIFFAGFVRSRKPGSIPDRACQSTCPSRASYLYFLGAANGTKGA